MADPVVVRDDGGQFFEKDRFISIIKKNVALTVAASSNVIQGTLILDAKWARHKKWSGSLRVTAGDLTPENQNPQPFVMEGVSFYISAGI